MDASDGLGHIDTGAMNFTRSAANDDPNGSTFHAPQGIALDAGGHRLFVADEDDNRVLVFDLSATNDLTGVNSNAAIVIGQPDFVTTSALTSQNGLSAPTSVAFDANTDMLYVADHANNRVVVFDAGTLASGMNASCVLGQSSFTNVYLDDDSERHGRTRCRDRRPEALHSLTSRMRRTTASSSSTRRRSRTA